MALYTLCAPEIPFCIAESKALYDILRGAFARDPRVIFGQQDSDGNGYRFTIRILGTEEYNRTISVEPLENRAMSQPVYTIADARFVYEDPEKCHSVDEVIAEIKLMVDSASSSAPAPASSPAPTPASSPAPTPASSPAPTTVQALPTPSPSDYDLL
jgi:hypothetical protein